MSMRINGKPIKSIIILGFIFILLTISIANSLIKIYATSSTSSTSQTVCVPIIMYHQVKATDLGKDVISPYEFENDLKYLADNNYNTITMSQLIDYVYNDEKLPENPIIITFDDGYLSTYKNVFPLIKKYNTKIVLSIIGIGTDNFSRVHDENLNYSHATWEQLNDMKESGLVEIQNHSYNLHRVCNGRVGCKKTRNESLEEYEAVLTEDIMKCQEHISILLGSTPNTFTYPYGEVSDSTVPILKKLGFKASLSCKYGVNLITKDPDKLYGLKRICRSHNYNIKKLIKEGMETLKYINE